MSLPRLLCSATFLAIAAIAGTASAQDSVTAAALFNRGLTDMNAGRFDTGCPAIAESQRLDPRLGTIFTLADCEARWGRIASAVAHYDDYLSLFAQLAPSQQAKQGERPKIAATQKAALEAQIPQLTLELPPKAPSGTVVKRDGTVLTQVSLGIPLPVDPLEHVITTQAPGGPVNEQRIKLEKGDKKRLVLEVKPAPAAPPAPPSASPAGPTVVYTPPPAMKRRSTALMVTGIVVTPIGSLVTLVGGVYVLACSGDRCNQGAPAGTLLTGAVLLGGGIAAIVYGAKSVPVKSKSATHAALSSWTPKVGIGPLSGSLRWTF
jgi:hypothetical protein